MVKCVVLAVLTVAAARRAGGPPPAMASPFRSVRSGDRGRRLTALVSGLLIAVLALRLW
jgi:hypothetical protein